MQFKNRKMVIATMHGKEAVITPPFIKHFQVHPTLPKDWNSDLLGTFSGEIPRVVSPLEALRVKCEQAMKNTDTDLAVASEGSFGPHPSIPFIPINTEMLMFMDLKNKLEITATVHSLETNFNSQMIEDLEALELFVRQTQFPAHALILKRPQGDKPVFLKGITQEDQLKKYAQILINQEGSAWVETDMRAMMNPTRMKTIGQCAEKLVTHILMKCPQCKLPGFSPDKPIHGLPCAQCGQPTSSAIGWLHRCAACGYQQLEHNKGGKLLEDPGFCTYCNP